MLKKTLSTLLSLALVCAFLVPTAALADPQEPATNATETTAEANQPDDTLAFADAFEEGKLTLPTGVSAAEAPKGASGLFLSVAAKSDKTEAPEYTGEKFTLSDDIVIGEGAPTLRLTFDGLSERKKPVTISFFLDDEESAFASFELKRGYSKTPWTIPGDQLKTFDTPLATGAHKLSFALSTVAKDTNILLRNITFMQATLPTVEFDIDETQGTIGEMNSSEDHSKECYGTMKLRVPQGYQSDYMKAPTESATTTDYELDYIRGRGNSTWMSDKKPYKVKLDKSSDLLGMGKNKHWVLLANRYDNSLLRNKITYWLGEQLSMPFTPKCTFVDVTMNGTYYGSYYLCEQIRVGKTRVNIVDLEEDFPQATELPEISGGYLLNMDGDSDEESGFTTKGGIQIGYESPSFEDYDNLAQRTYIKDYVQQVEDAINSSDFKNPNTTGSYAGKRYDELLDVDAAVDYYWIQMLSMNGDAYGSGSTYLFKDRDGTEHEKLTWGPLWDFDYVAWGDLEYGDPSVEGFDTTGPWFARLMQDETFASKMQARWSTIKPLLDEITREGGKLDEYAAQLATSQRYDVQKWGYYSDNWGYGEDDDGEGSAPAERTYASEVDQLRNWITARSEWVEENLNLLKPEPATVTVKDGDKVIKQFNTTVGSFYGELPVLDPKKGYYFAGWRAYSGAEDADEDDFELIDAESVVRFANTIVEANWVKESEATLPTKLNFQTDEAWVAFYEGDNYYGEETEFNMPYDVFPSYADVTEVTWTSSDESIATAGPYGNVTVHKLGDVTITGTCVGGAKRSYVLHSIEMDEDVEYPSEVELDHEALTIVEGDAESPGVHLQPQPCLFTNVQWVSLDSGIASVGESGLIEGVSPGTTYILGFLDSFEMLASCKVTVVSGDLSSAPVKVALKKSSIPFTGKKAKPAVKTVSIGSLKLKAGRDFTVTYPKNCKKVGIYSLTLKGKGKFSGAKKVKFQITPPKAKVKKLATKGGKLTCKLAKIKKKNKKQIGGVQIRWSTNKKLTKAKSKTVKVKKAVKTIKLGKAKKGKRYFAQVRTFKKVKGKKLYSAWSKVVRAK